MTLHASDWIAIGAVAIASVGVIISIVSYRRGFSITHSAKKLELVKLMVDAETEWEKALSYFREAKFEGVKRPDGDAIRDSSVEWFDQMMEFCSQSKSNISDSRIELQGHKARVPVETLDAHIAHYYVVRSRLRQTRVGAHDRLAGLKTLMQEAPVVMKRATPPQS